MSARPFAISTAAALIVVLACIPAKGAAGQGSAAVAGRVRPAAAAARLDTARLERAYARAAELPRLRSLLVEWHGLIVGERYFRGATRASPANIKSVSKSIVSALVGIAIARGDLRGTHQTLGELLPTDVRGLDTSKHAITIEDLLTMRTGLESTSFWNYGRWVSSRNWVRFALAQPVIAPRGPAGPMIYSTGSTHLLSAILTRATGMSTYRYAERYLAAPLGIRMRRWRADPQGIFFGGNDMRMTPREMLALAAAAGPLELGFAYTLALLQFDDYEVGSQDFSGNRIPGVPPHQAQASVTWRRRAFFATADALAASRAYVDDANTTRAPAYRVLHLRSGRTWLFGGPSLSAVMGVNNVFDARYAPSIVVNAARGKYYEPAPGRTMYVSVGVGVGRF